MQREEGHDHGDSRPWPYAWTLYASPLRAGGHLVFHHDNVADFEAIRQPDALPVERKPTCPLTLVEMST